MNILVLNCGGSSMKYQLLDMPSEKALAKGSIDRLGTGDAVFRHSGHSLHEHRGTIRDFTEGIRLCLECLGNDGLISGESGIGMIVHKLAHGGEGFQGAVLIDDGVLAEMRKLSTLAPVHNPPSIRGIEQCSALFPDTPQVGVFETTFHGTVPDYAYTYGLPREWRERYGVRKYGFHGASHSYIAQRMAAITGNNDLKLISCHLGSGTSVAAIRGGRSMDISSGFTPQSGTMMSTRPGDFDPWVFPYIMEVMGISASEANALMVKGGGLLGISGISGDMRDLMEAENAGDSGAHLAIETFCYQIRKYIGAFAAVLDGVDAITFTGGIGERSPEIRARSCKGLSFLGVRLDPARNSNSGEGFTVSAPESRVLVQVLTTDEELMVARQAYLLAPGTPVPDVPGVDDAV